MEVHNIHFKEIDSTNTWAKCHVAQLDQKKITCITADVQTHGRGRYGNSWVSKKGNLHMTFVLAVDPVLLPNLAQVTALACAKALRGLKVESQIKWPNDLRVEGKKIGGVLVESVLQQAVVGIGVNINEEVCASQNTTSLYSLTKCKWDLEEVKHIFLQSFLQYKDRLFIDVHQEFHALLAFCKEEVTYYFQNKQQQGIMLGVCPKGRLVVQKPCGAITYLTSEEVQVLRKLESGVTIKLG